MNVYKPEVTNAFKKEWGLEVWLANNRHYCGKLLHLKEGYRCSIHRHKIKDETFYILKGRVYMEWNGKSQVMYPGDALRIPTNTWHRFESLEGTATIVEISTQHFESDSYRRTKSEKVTWLKRKVLDKLRKWFKIDTIRRD